MPDHGTKRSARQTAETVRELVLPVVEGLGYTLWDVVCVREGPDLVLRVAIDSERGVTIDDCERMTRAVDPVLDEADPVDGPYCLEVSSPGAERVLVRDEHFARCAGETVRVRLFSPVDGSREWTGTLRGLDEERRVVVETDGTVRAFDRPNVSGVRTVCDFRGILPRGEGS